MFCCALFATLVAQPLALLGALGVNMSKPQSHMPIARSRTLPLPMMAVLVELAFLATIGAALEARLQPASLGSFHHICRLLAAWGLR